MPRPEKVTVQPRLVMVGVVASVVIGLVWSKSEIRNLKSEGNPKCENRRSVQWQPGGLQGGCQVYRACLRIKALSASMLNISLPA